MWGDGISISFKLNPVFLCSIMFLHINNCIWLWLWRNKTGRIKVEKLSTCLRLGDSKISTSVFSTHFVKSNPISTVPPKSKKKNSKKFLNNPCFSNRGSLALGKWFLVSVMISIRLSEHLPTFIAIGHWQNSSSWFSVLVLSIPYKLCVHGQIN